MNFVSLQSVWASRARMPVTNKLNQIAPPKKEDTAVLLALANYSRTSDGNQDKRLAAEPNSAGCVIEKVQNTAKAADEIDNFTRSYTYFIAKQLNLKTRTVIPQSRGQVRTRLPHFTGITVDLPTLQTSSSERGWTI